MAVGAESSLTSQPKQAADSRASNNSDLRHAEASLKNVPTFTHLHNAEERGQFSNTDT